MILAAGRGERLRPLTDDLPKSLIEVGGRPLIEHHIIRLAAAGVREIVVNTAYLGELLIARLGNGARFGVRIYFSPEPPGALDTGGGIAYAKPLLGRGPFLVINADLWTDYAFHDLPHEPDGLVHLVLVDNPPHHPEGDFTLHGDRVGLAGEPAATLTYAGIGVYRPELFSDCSTARFPLAPLLRQAAMQGQATGEHFRGVWIDIGTPERLAQAQALADAHQHQQGAPG